MLGFGRFGRSRSRTRRLLAAVGAALLLCLQTFSAAYLVHESDHDCCGEECPVCLQIHQCFANFQLTDPGTSIEPAPPEVPRTTDDFDPVAAFEPPAITLVSLKVRLDS